MLYTFSRSFQQILRVALFACFFLLPCSFLRGESLGLVELVDIALKNNPDTKKTWANVKRAQALVGTSKSVLYPMLDIQGNGTHGRDVKYPNGPETIFTNYGAELCLNYLLFDFGERRAIVQAAKEALQAANWIADFSIQKVISQVASYYYECINAEELLSSKLDSLHDAELILAAARDLHAAGLSPSTDLHTSKALVAQMEMELAVQKAALKIAYGKLLATLGISIEEKLELQRMPEGMRNPKFSEGIASLIALAEKQRGDLLAKKATLQEMESKYTAAKRMYLPKVRTVGKGGWNEYTKHQDSGYNYNVGIAIDIPLFRGFASTYEKRVAAANVELTVAEIQELQQAIGLEVLSYSASAQAAEEAFSWSGHYLEESYQSYHGLLEGYKAGLHNFFDLSQTQRNLADARMRQVQARTRLLVSLAELAFATGSILP